MRFRFEYEFDFEVTDEEALTANVPDPTRRPDKPLLASWSNISTALQLRLDEALADAPGLQMLTGRMALTPLDENNTDPSRAKNG